MMIFSNQRHTLYETKEIVRREFTVISEFKLVLKKCTNSIRWEAPLEALTDRINVSKEQDDLLKRMDKEIFKAQMPYMLVFFNKKTNGMIHTGYWSLLPVRSISVHC